MRLHRFLPIVALVLGACVGSGAQVAAPHPALPASPATPLPAVGSVLASEAEFPAEGGIRTSSMLRRIANEIDTDLTSLVIAWIIQRPGITSALCGAKRAWQIEESARGGSLTLPSEIVAKIDAAIAERGTPVTRAAV